MRNIISIFVIISHLLAFTLQPAFAAEANASKALPVDINKDTPRRTLGVKPAPNSLEGGMWTETDKVEKQGLTSGERTKHKELETYVQGVMNKIIPDNKDDIRVIVMDRPFFNATVAPNGYTEVWSGLLIRISSEDELAFVLGHEAGHFLHSHSITAFEEFKKRQATRMVTSALITVAAIAIAGNAGSMQQASDIMNVASGVNDILYWGSIFAFFGFSREQETYADLHGYEIARNAGYYPRSGEYVWQQVLSDQAASDDERIRKSKTFTNIFNTHPIESSRITYLEVYNKQKGDLTEFTAEKRKLDRISYRNKIRPYLKEWLTFELKRRDYGQTINIIDRLSIDNLDMGLLSFYKAESYRLRAKVGDLDNAIVNYKTAIKYEDAPEETYRQLAETYRKLSEFDQAKIYYKMYLEKFPNAEDAWIVEDTLQQVEKKLNQPKPNVTNVEVKNEKIK